MYIDTSDIKQEFKQLTSFDFSGNKTVGAICESFNSAESYKQFRIFTAARKDRAFGMIETDKIKEFAGLLMQYGNIEYCRKEAKIGQQKAVRIVKILNEAAIERNLAPVYVFRKLKPSTVLSEKQVSIIKYLLYKGYSQTRLAKIYNVSQSTIMQIHRGQTWCHLPSIIPIPSERRVVINQFVTVEKKQEAAPIIPFMNHPEDSAMYFKYVIFGETPVCPRCKNTKPYLLSCGTYRCSNSLCKLQFNCTSGTPFENTKIKPHTWLSAMYVYDADPNISTHNLALYLKTTQKTAWKIKERLKIAYFLPIWKRFCEVNKLIRA